MFEPTVLARTCKVDYLAHPSCSIENVKLFIEKGLTIRQIAQELDTTTFIVQRVLRALNLQPSRINYLARPKCPPELLLEGRRLGKPYSLIASELGISLNTLMGVKRALDATGVIVPDLDNPSSLNSNADYLNYGNYILDYLRLFFYFLKYEPLNYQRL